MVHLDLSGNPLGHGFSQVLGDLFPAMPNLRVLKLSQAKLAHQDFEILRFAMRDVESIEELDISWTGLGRMTQVSCAFLADIIGGYVDDGGGEHVGLPNLTSLDVSGNHFLHDGFRSLGFVLAQTQTIERLYMSQNSSAAVHTSTEKHFYNSYGDQGKLYVEKNLMRTGAMNVCAAGNVFCEFLAFMPRLRFLDCNNMAFTHETAFVLADSLCTHPAIEEVILDDNPIGHYGIRAIIRLVLLSGGPEKIQRVSLRCCERSTETGLYDKFYNFVDPSGSYTLDMANPYSRAMVNQSLKRWASSDQDWEKTFLCVTGPLKKQEKHNWKSKRGTLLVKELHVQHTHKAHDAKGLWKMAEHTAHEHKAHEELESLRDSKTLESFRQGLERWAAERIPHDGIVSFTLMLKLKTDKAAKDPKTFYEDVVSEHRIKLNDIHSQERFVKVLLQQVNFEGYQAVAGALATDFSVPSQFIINIAHKLPKDMRLSTSDLVQILLDARGDEAKTLELSKFITIDKTNEERKALIDELKSSGDSLNDAVNYYVGGNPTGEYRLKLVNLSDRRVARYLMFQNNWEIERDKIRERPDMSRYGTYQRFMNEHFDGRPFLLTQDWQLPHSGIFAFTYNSTRRIYEDPYKSTSLVKWEPWKEFIAVWKNAHPPEHDCSEWKKDPVLGKELMLRQDYICKKRHISLKHKLIALRQVSPWIAINNDQFRDFLDAEPNLDERRRIFVTLLKRVESIEPQIYTYFEKPPELKQSSVVEPQLRYSDLVACEEMLGRLTFFNPPTCNNTKYTLHLNIYEDRRILSCLLDISRHPVCKIAFINVFFGHSYEDLLELKEGIPRVWYDSLPTQGVVRTFFVAPLSNPSIKLYCLEVAKKYVAVANETIDRGAIWDEFPSPNTKPG
jgi:hypothetical protein